ncbi:hypothetical protein HNE_2499 [Hyphomonas neptunium ATCC 15444]|uniref:Uncharacterized protein n=2 Tax=Hyphomonas TaxID=85 RepID=Q0BZA0_HYPNA|nr:hypothetical protein HNE_2499 [Hyphomonas neptunium ATCC 15444]KCZ95282.1 hypothetical protein HHI_06414 [Hyphomonas hirschiana VP5]
MTESLLPLVYEDVISIRTIVEQAYDARLAGLEENSD